MGAAGDLAGAGAGPGLLGEGATRGCTRSSGPYWVRFRSDGPVLTPPGLLLGALAATVADELATAGESGPVAFGHGETATVLALLRATLPGLITAVAGYAGRMPTADPYRRLADLQQDIAARCLRFGDASQDCGMGGDLYPLVQRLAHHHCALRRSLPVVRARSLPVQRREVVEAAP
ncbi:hypothetical protein [Streptomyces daliensis]|uniref:Uncharacterized protein n=1 Tax=Streptomyces daliensis TaxID=299421 RepID=A0A8T4J1A4_9ACTN|nr:hypothetical protein [Streptomyces daliensis]